MRADRAPLTDDQLLGALATGNVVFMYGTHAPPPELVEAARAVAPPFTRTLAASGQSIILARRGGTSGIVALAWTHLLAGQHSS